MNNGETVAGRGSPSIMRKRQAGGMRIPEAGSRNPCETQRSRCRSRCYNVSEIYVEKVHAERTQKQAGRQQQVQYAPRQVAGRC